MSQPELLEIRQYLKIIVKRWYYLVFGFIFAGLLGLIYGLSLPAQYKGEVTLRVGASTQSDELDRSNIETSKLLTQAYADLAVRQPILQGTIDKLNLDISWTTLRDQIEITLVPETQLVEIEVVASSSGEAYEIVNEIANQLILLSPNQASSPEIESQIEFVSQRLTILQTNISEGQTQLNALENNLNETDSIEEKQTIQARIDNLTQLLTDWQSSYNDLLEFTADQESPNHLSILEPPQAFPENIRTNPILISIISALAGILIGVALTYIHEFFDDTISSSEQLQQNYKLDVLGIIDSESKDRPTELIINQTSTSDMSEVFNTIQSTIQFAWSTSPFPCNSIVVASPSKSDEKSAFVANLGVAMARSGLKTIIVDSEFRSPSLHEKFNLSLHNGVSDIIDNNEVNTSELLKTTSQNDLSLVTRGEHFANPGKILNSPQMSHLVSQLEQESDIIIYDSPPALPYADASILANLADRVVLLIEAGKDSNEDIKEILSRFQRAKAGILGVVLFESNNSLLESKLASQFSSMSPFSRLLNLRKMPTPSSDLTKLKQN